MADALDVITAIARGSRTASRSLVKVTWRLLRGTAAVLGAVATLVSCIATT
ncbi:hypothetical protein [Kineococcus sp. SYSU DK005]|uniref:hypothetical protein n=1 Tax=Kineococcus sp. SYSU DK005 TaxID=3383126 RepID=UPI003D7C3F35